MVTIEKAQEFLNQAYEARNNAVTIAYELAEMKKTSRILIASYQLTFGKTNQKYDISAEISKIEEKASELEKERNLWLAKVKEIETFIKELDIDVKMKRILSLRYLSFQKWSVIQKEMKYSRSHVMRMHKQGLEFVSDKLQNETK
nr:MAG TPA: Protein of unknown function (DUF1492) [Caudoviricetes sp.]